MNDNSPILILEDDEDDQFFLTSILEKIAPKNPVICFSEGQKALDYLKTTPDRPFMILSDINLAPMSGLEFRREIEQDPQLRPKSIPFIFMTHPVYDEQVQEAYELTIQGYFEKGNQLAQMQSDLETIITYWSKCVRPNSISK